MSKQLYLKYAGECATCGASLDAGQLATWHMRGVVTCTTCKYSMTPEEWQARQERKQERAATYAANARSRSESAFAAVHQTLDMIPLGQPILVGHHSERRHRRDLARVDNNIRRSINEQKKAEYWEKKATNAANPRGISSHDPDAVVKLTAKLEREIAGRDRMKAINTAMKNAGLKKGQQITPELIDAAGIEITERERNTMLRMHRYSWEASVFNLTNTNAEIRRLQKRIDDLSA